MSTLSQNTPSGQDGLLTDTRAKRLAISGDDPFRSLFLQKTLLSQQQLIKKDKPKHAGRSNSQIPGKYGGVGSDINSEGSRFRNLDGTQASSAVRQNEEGQNDDDDKNSDDSYGYKREIVVPENAYWRDDEYHKLPPNVQNAVDIARAKQKHSPFFYKLQNLNDMIYVFRDMYYTNVPLHDRLFLEKKQREKYYEKLKEFESDSTSLQLPAIKIPGYESSVKTTENYPWDAEAGISAKEMIAQFRKKLAKRDSSKSTDNTDSILTSQRDTTSLSQGAPRRALTTIEMPEMNPKKLNLMIATQKFAEENKIQEAAEKDEGTPMPKLKGFMRSSQKSHHSSPLQSLGVKNYMGVLNEESALDDEQELLEVSSHRLSQMKYDEEEQVKTIQPLRIKQTHLAIPDITGFRLNTPVKKFKFISEFEKTSLEEAKKANKPIKIRKNIQQQYTEKKERILSAVQKENKKYLKSSRQQSKCEKYSKRKRQVSKKNTSAHAVNIYAASLYDLHLKQQLPKNLQKHVLQLPVDLGNKTLLSKQLDLINDPSVCLVGHKRGKSQNLARLNMNTMMY